MRTDTNVLRLPIRSNAEFDVTANSAAQLPAALIAVPPVSEMPNRKPNLSAISFIGKRKAKEPKLTQAPAPSVTVRAPGKVNLALHVGERGGDGYHPVVTVYQAVDLYEKVTATFVKPGRGVIIDVTGPGWENVPLDHRNTAHKAATLLAKRLGVKPDVKLEIEKAVPVAGGMAGGSADAAATLVACNELWESGLTKVELLALAAEIGADVPFALLGGTAIGTGRGHVLNPIITRGEFHWAFGLSDEGLSTPVVYRTFDSLIAKLPIPELEPGFEPAYIDLATKPDAGLMRALVSGDAVTLGEHLVNDLQPAALELRPQLQRTMDLAKAAGALGVIVSGSGPTVAALAKSRRHAKAIAAQWVAAGVVTGMVVTTSPMGGTQIYKPTT